MGGRLGRWLAYGLIAIVTLVSIVLLAVHTPWARARALSWATDFASHYQLKLETNALGYNALTRRVTLTDVRLAAIGHEQQPFLIAKRIEVRLPWTVYRGRFAMDHLEVDGGQVIIERDAAGNTNLPAGSKGPAPEKARHLDVRGLTLKPIDLRYVDHQHDFDLAVPGIETELLKSPLGAEGSFAVRGQTLLRLKKRTMTLAPIDAKMTFDGSNVALNEALLASKELNAVLSGTIHRVLDSTFFELALNGIVNLEPATQWAPPPVGVTGVVKIAGTITGPFSTPVTVLHVSGTGISIGHEPNIALDGPVKVTMDAFSGEGMVLKPATGGEIRAAFNVPWGQAPPSTARAEWTGLDAQSAFRLGEFTPQAIGAAFQGNGTFQFGDARRYEAFNRATGRASRGLVPITGQLHAKLVVDEWKIEHSHTLPGIAIEGTTGGRVNNAKIELTTLAGPAHARVSDVATASNSAVALGIDMPEIASEIHGALDAPMTLSGSFHDPKVDTAISADALEVPLVGPATRVSAHVVSDRRVATVSSIEGQHGSATVKGDIVADITNSRWSGTLNVNAPDASELQTALDEEWRVKGPITATATLGGTFANYQFDTQINGSAFTWAGQSYDGFTAKAIVTADAIDASSLHITQGAGSLDGPVRYEWESGAYTAKLTGEALTWNATVLAPNDTKATFSLQFDGTGTTALPRGRVTSTFTLTGGTAGSLIDTGELSVDLLGPQAQYAVKLPSLGAVINGDIATSTPYDYRASAALTQTDIARLAPLVGAVEGEVSGAVTGNVTASGRLADTRNRVALLDLSAIDASIGGVPVSLNAPAKVSLRGDDVTLQGLDMKVGAGKLTASGDWNTKLDGKFQGTFTGDFKDAVRMGRAFGAPVTVDGSGAMSVNFKSSGSRATTAATLTVQDGTFGWGGAPVVQHLNINAALDGEALTVERVSGSVATLGVVGDFSASGRARVPTLELAAIDGELNVDSARFTLSGIPVEQQRASHFRFAKGVVTASDVNWLVAENALVLEGSVAYAPNPDPVMDLSVKGLIDMRVLSAFISTMAFDGSAKVDARIKGTMAKPLLDGRIDLDDAEIALSEPRLVLSEMSGPITLSGQRINISGVSGFANGGNITLDGNVDVDGLTLTGGEINIQAQDVALELPKGLRSEFDGLITFRPDPKAPSVTGDIRIVQSSYTDTITLAALARRATLPVSPTVDRPYLDRLRLNLAVTTTEDITVDNNYGKLEAGANIRVVGTVAQPGVDGRITLREGGEVFLAGRTFRITRGDISFTDLRHIHPEFNIAADATINGKDVTMTLTGTLERPTVDLSSQGGSQTPGELASQIVGNSNGDAALALVSADLLGVTGRAIGLDAFRVEQGSYTDEDFRNRDFQEDPTLAGNNKLDPTTRLTIAKRLSNQVEVTISQNLRESGKTTFIVSYLPGHNVEVRAISQDNATQSIGIRHQISFGGGVKSSSIERRVRPTVKAINFVNVDPALEAESRSHLRVKPGDQFDFLKLQRDIDRLRESFHTRGYYEARVRTKRIEDPDVNEVTLEYRVEQGPKTTLQIVGLSLPQKEIEALEEAWGHADLDRFLIDEVTGRVRRYVVTNTGELSSVVVGTVDRSADGSTKRLRIDVTPGVPVTGREIRFTGNTSLSSSQLKSEIAATGLEVEAWLDPTVVEKELQSLYNEAGYLKAKVTAGPIDVDGSVGVLPVTIVEGPRSNITQLAWAGVAEARLPEAEKAIALKLPTPLVNTDVNDARRRVEEMYRRQGFNAAEVEVETDVAEDDSVTLKLSVVEGPQQVLEEVVTSGADITRGDVVSQALRLPMNKPVNLDEWARARKRLYDTNVFRQVDIQPVNSGPIKDGVQPVKAAVTVEEYPPWSLRYGTQLEGERTPDIGEFTSSRNLGFVSELKNPNLFGRALTLGLFGQYQRLQQDASVFLATSRLFGWRARSTLYGFAEREHLEDDGGDTLPFITDVKGVSADQRWRLRGFEFVYGYRFERNRTYDPDPSPNDPLPLDVLANLARLSAATVIDRRNDPLNATKGTFSSLSWDYSSRWLGSDVVNRKLLFQQHLFVPVAGRLVLASRVQSGLVFGPDPLLPSDRFRAGGATTVRGYGEDSLGPRSDSGVPLGGETLLILNQEARFQIYRWVRGVAFVDAGNISGKGEPFQWSDMKLGYGFGLRFDSPVGLLRVDFGIPHTPLPTATPSNGLAAGRWTFGFGHIF